MVMVCKAVELLPHASVALQVRATSFVPPQALVTMSVKLMVTVPHPSCAVAMPVTLVAGEAGHSRVISAGAVMDGAVLSRTVIFCKAVALLPQPSVAVQVREINLVPPQLL